MFCSNIHVSHQRNLNYLSVAMTTFLISSASFFSRIRLNCFVAVRFRLKARSLAAAATTKKQLRLWEKVFRKLLSLDAPGDQFRCSKSGIESRIDQLVEEKKQSQPSQ